MKQRSLGHDLVAHTVEHRTTRKSFKLLKGEGEVVVGSAGGGMNFWPAA